MDESKPLLAEIGAILTPEEAAALLKRPERTIVRMCAAGQLPGARKAGRCWRIPEQALVAFFGGGAGKSEGDAPRARPSVEARGADGRTLADRCADGAHVLRLLDEAGPGPQVAIRRRRRTVDGGGSRR